MAPCTKKSFSSPLRAALALRAIQATRKVSVKTEVAIYLCRSCHTFHLTSDRRSARNKWTTTSLGRLRQVGSRD